MSSFPRSIVIAELALLVMAKAIGCEHRKKEALFWYLKINVDLSFLSAKWPPNRQTIEKSPCRCRAILKNPSPSSLFQRHISRLLSSE